MKISCLAQWALMMTLVGSALALAADDKPTQPAWLTNYKQALAQATADKKIVLADFTGSDWCHYCIKLKQEVLDTPEFQKIAVDKLALLEVDFPRHKQLPDDIKQQNAELGKQFKVRGFPTIIFLDANGKEIGRIVGYAGKEWWMKQFNLILTKAAA